MQEGGDNVAQFDPIEVGIVPLDDYDDDEPQVSRKQNRYPNIDIY